MKAVISIKKSLFASAVAVALITTAGSVNGYDVVVSSKLTYGMKRSLRIATEEAAEEAMADDSECGSLGIAGEDSECESLDIAEEAKGAPSPKFADDTNTKTNNTDGAQQLDKNGGNAGGNNWTPPLNPGTPPSTTGTPSNPPSTTETPPGGNAPTTNSGKTSVANSGNVNEKKYSGSMSDIEFSSIQSEANPGTVMPQ